MISPYETIPALVDPDGPDGGSITVCEWGAIAIYLAEKTDRLLPSRGAARYSTLEWLAFQIASVAPTINQADHFVNAEHEHRYAEERFCGEAARTYHTLDARLASVDFLAGDYSVADIGTFPWVRDPDLVDLELSTYPNVGRWIERLESRAAVREALRVALPGAVEG
jgi:GST-like protein